MGAASGVVCAVLCAMFVFANPYSPPLTFQRAGVWALIVPGLGAGGLLSAVAAIRRRPRALLMLFFISFLPFGLYLLLTLPRIFGWIGASHLGYLVASLLLRVSEADEA
ncbi:MAG: hypothetical protein ABI868_23340 [Acidobacteriota bacterium]